MVHDVTLWGGLRSLRARNRKRNSKGSFGGSRNKSPQIPHIKSKRGSPNLKSPISRLSGAFFDFLGTFVQTPRNPMEILRLEVRDMAALVATLVDPYMGCSWLWSTCSKAVVWQHPPAPVRVWKVHCCPSWHVQDWICACACALRRVPCTGGWLMWADCNFRESLASHQRMSTFSEWWVILCVGPVTSGEVRGTFFVEVWGACGKPPDCAQSPHSEVRRKSPEFLGNMLGSPMSFKKLLGISDSLSLSLSATCKICLQVLHEWRIWTRYTHAHSREARYFCSPLWHSVAVTVLCTTPPHERQLDLQRCFLCPLMLQSPRTGVSKGVSHEVSTPPSKYLPAKKIDFRIIFGALTGKGLSPKQVLGSSGFSGKSPGALTG